MDAGGCAHGGRRCAALFGGPAAAACVASGHCLIMALVFIMPGSIMMDGFIIWNYRIRARMITCLMGEPFVD